MRLRRLLLAAFAAVAAHPASQAGAQWIENGVPLEGDGWTSTDEEYEGFMKRDLEEHVPAVDAVVMLPGWSKSGGAGREGEKALELGKPMFMWNPDTPTILVTLPRWLFNEHHTTKRLEKS